MTLFAPSFIYEDRAEAAIRAASAKWNNVEEIVAAIEWAIIRDPAIGPVVNERGLRGFVYPGARSLKEPDVDVLYEEKPPDYLIVHDLIFRDAKAHYAGRA